MWNTRNWRPQEKRLTDNFAATQARENFMKRWSKILISTGLLTAAFAAGRGSLVGNAAHSFPAPQRYTVDPVMQLFTMEQVEGSAYRQTDDVKLHLNLKNNM